MARVKRRPKKLELQENTAKLTKAFNDWQDTPSIWKFSPALKVVNFKFPETEFQDGGKRVLKYDSASFVNADWWDYDRVEPNLNNRKLPIAYMPWEDMSKTDTGRKCSGLKSNILEMLKQLNPGVKIKTEDVERFIKKDYGCNFKTEVLDKAGLRLENCVLPWPIGGETCLKMDWIIGCTNKMAFEEESYMIDNNLWENLEDRMITPPSQISQVHVEKWPCKFIHMLKEDKTVKIFFDQPNPKKKSNTDKLWTNQRYEEYNKYMKATSVAEFWILANVKWDGKKNPEIMGNFKNDIGLGYARVNPDRLNAVWKNYLNLNADTEGLKKWLKKWNENKETAKWKATKNQNLPYPYDQEKKDQASRSESISESLLESEESDDDHRAADDTSTLDGIGMSLLDGAPYRNGPGPPPEEDTSSLDGIGISLQDGSDPPHAADSEDGISTMNLDNAMKVCELAYDNLMKAVKLDKAKLDEAEELVHTRKRKLDEAEELVHTRKRKLDEAEELVYWMEQSRLGHNTKNHPNELRD